MVKFLRMPFYHIVFYYSFHETDENLPPEGLQKGVCKLALLMGFCGSG